MLPARPTPLLAPCRVGIGLFAISLPGPALANAGHATAWNALWAGHPFGVGLAILAGVMVPGLLLLLFRANRRLAEANRTARASAGQLDLERRQLRTLFETLPDLLWLKDAQGAYQGCNPRFEALFGKGEAELIGRRDQDFLPAEMAEQFRAEEQKAAQLGHPVRDERMLTFADGHQELLETTRTPMYDKDGRLLGVLGLAHDVTERQRAERFLALQHEFAGLLVDDPERETLLSAILDTALKLPDLDGGGLYWREADGGYRLCRQQGLSPAFIAQAQHLAPDSPQARVIRAGRLQCACTSCQPHCTDPSLIDRPLLRDEGIHALVVLPILVEGEPLACLNLASKHSPSTSHRTLTALETLTRQFTRALERLQAREDAQRQRANLDKLLDSLGDMIFVVDLEGKILHFNKAVQRMLGHGPSLLGTPVAGLHPAEFRPMLNQTIGRLLSGRHSPCPLPLLRADGTRIQVDTQIIPGEWNGARCLYGICRDLTEQTRILAALRESEANLRRAQAVSRTGSWHLDIPGNRLTWSEETHRLFRLPQGTPLSMEDFLALVHPDDRQRVEEAWRAALGGAPYDLEHRILTGGGVRWVRELAEVRRAEDGSPLSGVGTVQDVTERRQMEELGRYGAFQAGVAEMAVSVLHNIGNAITAVVNDTNAVSRAGEELARLGALLERNLFQVNASLSPQGLNRTDSEHLIAIQTQAVSAIQRLCQRGLSQRSQRINASVRHIADIVRLQQDASLPATREAPFDAGQCLNDALTMLNDTLQRHGIRVSLELAPGLPPLQLSRNRLLQALINVLKNAYEAIRARPPDPGFCGLIRIFAGPLGPQRCRIQVTDNGIGLPPGLEQEVFRFGFSTKARGSGFGLHGTALFVQEMGGEIRLESPGDGQGACLTLELPAVPPDRERPTPQEWSSR
ncbi:MAG: PAS domain S-box protein [Pseudomonadota bacterium]